MCRHKGLKAPPDRFLLRNTGCPVVSSASVAAATAAVDRFAPIMTAFRDASQQRVAHMQTRLDAAGRACAAVAAQFGEAAVTPQQTGTGVAEAFCFGLS